MATVTLRSVKGSPLTLAEVDANFTNINNDKVETSTYTPLDVLTKIKTVDGAGSGLDADLLDGLNTASANTPSTVVTRDSSGNFSAGTITANLTGNVTGNVTGSVSGSAGSVTGNAATATVLQNIRNIAIFLTGDTTGNASVAFNGSADANISITTSNTALSIVNDDIANSTIRAAKLNLSSDTLTVDTLNANTITGLASVPASINLTANNTTNETVYLTFADGTAGTQELETDTNLSYNPSTNVLQTTAQIANTVNLIANNTTNETVYLTFADGTTGTQELETDNGLYFNPSTNTLTTSIFAGTATSARYADLAEKYTTDKNYDPGTVVTVSMDTGGAEVTQSWLHSQKVIGVISTKPAYLMNSESEGQAVALKGRVPVKVFGPIKKGELLVSTPDGTAIGGDHQNSFAISLETNESAKVKLVECVIL